MRRRMDCMRKILQIAKAQKSGGMFPPHPPGFGLTRKRVSAERSALANAHHFQCPTVVTSIARGGPMGETPLSPLNGYEHAILCLARFPV